MSNLVYNAAKLFLQTKYQTENPKLLYRTLISKLCQPKLLAQEPALDHLYKFIYIASFPDRRIYGNEAKIASVSCLKALKPQTVEIDPQICVQFLLALSNVLIYDEDFVRRILKLLQTHKDTLNYKQLFAIFHSLYKLGVSDPFWIDYLVSKLESQSKDIPFQEHIQLLYITSNLYQLGKFNPESLENSVKLMTQKLQFVNSLSSKTTFQYAQLLFNLYPELINKDSKSIDVAQDNPFKVHFPPLKALYQKSRAIIDIKKPSQSVDYHENINFPNILRVKAEDTKSEVTEYEKGVGQVLQMLQVAYLQQYRACIYDVDFYLQVKEGIFLNCNGPVHFIETLEGDRVGISPNFQMQNRHLKYLNKKIVNLDYFKWGKIELKEKQKQELARLLEL